MGCSFGKGESGEGGRSVGIVNGISSREGRERETYLSRGKFLALRGRGKSLECSLRLAVA